MSPPFPRPALAGLLLAPALALADPIPPPAPALPAESPPPLTLAAAYTGEHWHNTRGGLSRGQRYLDLLLLSAAAQTDAWGAVGGTLYASVLVHHNSAEGLVGETQVLSSNDFGDGAKVFEAWYEQALGEAGSSLRFGLYDLNAEFDQTPAASLFVNSDLGMAVDVTQSGTNGPSVAPLSALGLRGAWAVTPGWRLQAVILDAVPGEAGGRNYHNSIELDADEGALLVAEVLRQGESGQAGLGAWHYSTRHPRLAEAGAAFSQGLWLHGERRLWRGEAATWTGFARLGHASPDTHQVSLGGRVGVVREGRLWRDDDRVGVVVSSARNGRDYRAALAAAGTATATAETFVELTWQTRLTSWLMLQPDLQYFINPGTDPARGNALVVGLRFRLEAGWP